MTLPVSWMFNEVYDLLSDFPPVSPSERYPSEEMIGHYLNMGQYAMWPRIYRVVRGNVYADGVDGEYVWQDDLAYGRLTYVEVGAETSSGDTVYQMVPDEAYETLPAPYGRYILKVRPEYQSQVTSDNVRLTVALPLAPIASYGSGGTGLMAMALGQGASGDGKSGDGKPAVVPAGMVPGAGVGSLGAMYLEWYPEDFSGPDYAIEGPVLYAMSRICSRGVHRRLDYGRQSVEYQNRSATPNELLSAAVFFLDEFERRVDQWQSVQPQSLF